MGVDESKLSEEELAKIAEDDAESEEDQKIYKKRRWQHKLRLGRHYRMERFTIFFFTLLSSILLFVGLGWNSERIRMNDLVGTKAVYSESLTFSLSGVSGTIEDVYRNSEGTRAYVLVNMSDLSGVSLDTNDYELFLTGFNKGLSQDPASSMFLFSTSGYLGIEFYDERGLANEIYDVTIRNNSEVTKRKELTDKQLAELEDASYGEFDQANFYVNVGAEEVVVMDVLDRELDPVQLYYALVGRYDEDEVFEEIDTKVDELNQLLVEYDEYNKRLVNLGYEGIEKPKFMAGDKIDDEGHFRPEYIVRGAHDIEYIGLRSTDGFVTQVVEDPSRFREYMAERRAVEQLAVNSSSNKEDDPEFNERITEIIRDDGYLLELDGINMSEATSSDLSARDAVNSLMSISGQYLRVKRSLQIESMRNLLILDAEIRTQGQGFSANTDEEFLTIY